MINRRTRCDNMNEDMKDIRCKDCGAHTSLITNEIAPNGIYKIGKEVITYHACNEPLCPCFTRIVK